MKIIFIIPKAKSISGGKSLTLIPNVGIAYLSAFLKKNGIEVCVFDDGVEDGWEKLFTTIRESKPDVIGITIYSYNYGYACGLIKAIRDNFRLPLVLGGIHVNIIKKQILLDTGADFAVKHEGEYTLLELLEAIKNKNNDFSVIKGLIWRGENSRIIENPDRPLIKDLDILPFPDYDIFDITKYFCYKDKTLPLITSRGCPYGCNFCSIKLSMGQSFRPRGAENVVDEIECYVSKGWAGFDIDDDCFTLDMKRVEAICDLIIQKKLNIKFKFPNGIRADKVSYQLLKKLKLAGCTYIVYGCETGNKRILKLIKKGVTLEQVRQAVEWANEVGISNSVSFIIGHTEETYKEALDTLVFARSLSTDFSSFYNLLPYPGTETYAWVKKYGRSLIPPENYLENISACRNEPIFDTEEFTREQRIKVLNMGFNLFRKKYFKFRLGPILGSILYYISLIRIFNKFFSYFVLDNNVGRGIYISLSKILQRRKK